MSRYHGNDQRCPCCGLKYRDLRTGFSYEAIKLMYWTPQDADPSEWKYKRRGTVLGKWHQLKKELWQKHLEECEEIPF